jgi:hypothetical protein
MAYITLVNTAWHQGVHVIVRKGNQYNPTDNPVVADMRMSDQQRWGIDAGDDDVYYQRDNDPDNPDGTFTPWTTISSANGDQTVPV